MINHVRTLLLNTSAGNLSGQAPGAEYVDPNYRAAALPPVLAQVHRALFGASNEALYCDYTVAQLLATVHASRLAEDSLLDDPRITYDPPEFRAFRETLFGAEVSPLSATTATVQWPQPPTVVEPGACELLWKITFEESGATITQRKPVIRSSFIPAGQPLTLPEYGTTLFAAGETPGDRFSLRLTVRPRRDISGIMATAFPLAAREELRGALFSATDESHVRRWEAVYREGLHAPDRYAAVILAYAAAIGRAAESDRL